MTRSKIEIWPLGPEQWGFDALRPLWRRRTSAVQSKLGPVWPGKMKLMVRIADRGEPRYYR